MCDPKDVEPVEENTAPPQAEETQTETEQPESEQKDN
jgi:hypothetical protein